MSSSKNSSVKDIKQTKIHLHFCNDDFDRDMRETLVLDIFSEP